MLNLPAEVTAFLALFAPLFSSSVWYHAQILLIGAILTPGKRTVTAILSVMGLRQHRHFQNRARCVADITDGVVYPRPSPRIAGLFSREKSVAQLPPARIRCLLTRQSCSLEFFLLESAVKLHLFREIGIGTP